MANLRAVILGLVVAMAGMVCLADEGAGSQPAVQAEMGATTQAAMTDEQWKQLVERLGSADFKVRRVARDDLKKVTVDDLESLKKLVAQAGDAEVKAALQGRIEEINEQLVTDPPGISVDLKDATLGKVAEALAKATGGGVHAWPEERFAGNRPERWTLKVKNEPFWDVFCKFSDQHGLQLQWQRDLTIMAGEPGLRRCVRVGGVAIFPQSIVRQTTANLQEAAGKQMSDPTMSLSYTIAVDPRVKVIRYGGTKFLDVTDDLGNVLVHNEGDAPPQFWRSGGPNQVMWTEGTQLTIPANMGKKIVSAKGELNIVVQIGEQSVSVANFEKSWKNPVKIGGRTATFTNFDTKDGRINFMMQVRSEDPTAPVEGMDQEGGATMRMALVDAAGKLIWESNVNFGMGAGIGAQYTLPLTAKFTVATKSKEMKVGFELKDLPLPGK